ncbi:MAG TPA: hypothetical protein VLD61_08840, partial [Methylomirabilota bacterium]|nr:hypothetical protein [Methylomirabilota bacterium]
WRRAGPGEVVHLIGTAAVGTTLTVRVDGTPVGRYPLRGGVRARLEFALPPAHRQLVELRFASALTDDTGRRRAFHVEGTNLFAETDLPPGLDGTPDGGPAAP